MPNSDPWSIFAHWIISWSALTLIESILIGGIAFSVLGMNPPQYRFAQACLIASGILLALRVGWWLAIEHSDSGRWQRSLLAILLFGATGSLCVEAVAWVRTLESASKPRLGALVLQALYVGIRNMPERAGVPTWNDAPWDEDDYADVRLTITNALDLPLQDLALEIDVTEGEPKYGIAGIAQLTKVSGIAFHKPPMEMPTLRLKGQDGKTYNFPLQGFLDEHRIVPQERMFCPRLESKDVIRLILATIHVGDHNRPPQRLKITGTYTTESAGGKVIGNINEIVTVKE